MSEIQKLVEQTREKYGIKQTINTDDYPSLLDFYDEVINKYLHRPAYSCLGQTITYDELDKYANAFAAYIQHHTNLKQGDKIAIQLPNILQQPIAVLGAFRAGLVVVNTNPLYTERELEHQFIDADVKGLVVLANVAETASKLVHKTKIETVIVTELFDLHGFPKKTLMNLAVKYVKKMVPDFHFEQSVSFSQVLKKGKLLSLKPVSVAASDVAILQYTGGTTGLAKGAMLMHSNVVANTLQSAEYFPTYGLTNDGDTLMQPLPLYHIYAAVVSYIGLYKGCHIVLIPNPRDIPSLVKDIKRYKVDGFCGLNTLFVALCNNAEFRKLDFSNLKMTLSGGMALTRYAADNWKKITGCEICEGYGLTETSPVVAVNPGNGNRLGTVGVVVPSTDIDIRAEGDRSVGINEPGELCIKGPQLMKGYWNNEAETAETIIDGWFYTGDIAVLTEEGRLKIVDRKKDMILVSGFNVYPNEVEDILTSHPAIQEAAAISHNDERSGEVVHAYVVKELGQNVTEDELRAFCREKLAGYKVPKRVFFKDDLPKSNVGKILRREVRVMAEAEANRSHG